MDKTEVSKRQLVVLIVMMILGAKFLLLPSVLAQFAGRDAWIAAAVLFVSDFICLLAILRAFAVNKNEMSFTDVLSKTLTGVVAKIILLLYALFFVYRSIFSYLSVYGLLTTMFSTVTNWPGFVIPVLFVVGYNVFKGIKNIARLTEAMIFFFVIAALLIIVLSATGVHSLAPLLADGLAPVGSAMQKGAFWFSDCVFLVFLLAKFKPSLKEDDAKTRKKGEKALFLSASAGFWFAAICTVAFVAVFISLYGNLAQYGENAIAKVSGFGSGLSSESRLDWLLVMLWLSAVVIKTMVFLYCACAAVRAVIGVRGEKAEMLVTVGIGLLILILPLFVDFKGFANDYIFNGAGRFVFYIPQYVVPLLLPLLVFLANRKGKGKAEIVRQKGL